MQFNVSGSRPFFSSLLDCLFFVLDKRLFKMVATNAAFARLYDLLTSMPGVGPMLAFTLIALLPELGEMSRKQIAALVGLAPYDFDSGKTQGAPKYLRRSDAGP